MPKIRHNFNYKESTKWKRTANELIFIHLVAVWPRSTDRSDGKKLKETPFHLFPGCGGVQDSVRPMGPREFIGNKLLLLAVSVRTVNSGLIGPPISRVITCLPLSRRQPWPGGSAFEKVGSDGNGVVAVCLDSAAAALLVKLSGTRWMVVILFDLLRISPFSAHLLLWVGILRASILFIGVCRWTVNYAVGYLQIILPPCDSDPRPPSHPHSPNCIFNGYTQWKRFVECLALFSNRWGGVRG